VTDDWHDPPAPQGLVMIASNKVATVEAFSKAKDRSDSGQSSCLSQKQIVRLTDVDRRQLERWVRGRTTPQRLALRSRIVLLAASGLSLRRIAAAAQTSVRTVVLWRRRFVEQGLCSLQTDAPGRGRKPSIARETHEAIAAERTSSAAGEGVSSVRATAAKFGVGRSSVQRIWSTSATSDKGNSGTTRMKRDPGNGGPVLAEP
jgi:transposase